MTRLKIAKYFAALLIIKSPLFLTCHQSEIAPRLLLISEFDAPEIAAKFRAGAESVADSLGLELYIINNVGRPNDFAGDTLFTRSSIIAAPDSMRGDPAVFFKRHKKAPHVRYVNRFSGEDYYLAGRKAGRHIVEKFGSIGRFGIIVSSLENSNSNESIRGFREELMNTRNKWRQVNIITYEKSAKRAVAQFRHLNRFGSRIIWFFADTNEAMINLLQAQKKNNYFMIIDLHANKNYIMLLQNEFLDAVITRDVESLGRESALAMVRTLQSQTLESKVPFRPGILIFSEEGLDFK